MHFNCMTHKQLFDNLCKLYGSLTRMIDLHYTNCTTLKPFYRIPYDSYRSLTFMYALSLANDMSCTTLKPLFHNLCKSYGLSTCIYALSLTNDMYLTNCTSGMPLFQDPQKQFKKEDAPYSSYQCMYIEQPLSLTLLRLLGKLMVNLRNVKINVAKSIVQKQKPRKYL